MQPSIQRSYEAQIDALEVERSLLLAELEEAYEYVARCNLAEATDHSRAWLIRAAARRKGASP